VSGHNSCWAALTIPLGNECCCAARGECGDDGCPWATRENAQRIIDLGAKKLAARIRSVRESDDDESEFVEISSDDVAELRSEEPTDEARELRFMIHARKSAQEQAAAIREWARRTRMTINAPSRVPSDDVVDALDAVHAALDAVPLTERERMVVALAAAGLPNKEIAHLLGIPTLNVSVHLYRAYSKVSATVGGSKVDD
jgi:DNA-binding NarL/FixJ family response regulator